MAQTGRRLRHSILWLLWINFNVYCYDCVLSGQLAASVGDLHPDNIILFPSAQEEPDADSPVERRERLGGLNYYHRKAA